MEERDLQDIALGAARAAAAVHRRYLGSVARERWSEKGVADFVTHVDLEAEAAAVAYIRERLPGHAFLAEEGTESGPPRADGSGPAAVDRSVEWLWVIDPLDGTTNYLHRYPAYAASVAVLHYGEPITGAVVSGATGEEWTAYRGGGARLDGRPIRVSTVDRLSHALVGTGFPFKTRSLIPVYLRQFERTLRQTAGIRRAGSAALDLCHLATGYFDAFWELHLAPWDVAAGTLIVREAGGIVTTLEGQADVLNHGSVLAANPALHEAFRALLREASEPD